MNKVRVIRKARNLLLRDVAKSTGCSIAFLSDVELNRRGAKPETWKRIAEALNTTVEQLKGDDHDTAPDDSAGG